MPSTVHYGKWTTLPQAMHLPQSNHSPTDLDGSSELSELTEDKQDSTKVKMKMTQATGATSLGRPLALKNLRHLILSWWMVPVEQVVVYSTLPQEYSTLTFGGEVVAVDGRVEERSEVIYCIERDMVIYYKFCLALPQ